MPVRPRCVALFALGALIVVQVGAGAQAPARPPTAEQLFNDAVVQRVDLRVNSTDWEKLRQNFRENDYYPADFVFDGQTVRNVGIRSRGGGSRSGAKPGLRVDFDRYTDQTYLGLKSIVLDNLTQDASGVHETVAMKVFARLGIPAPREAHVRLYVNNAYAGVYAVIESIDKNFLARVFGTIDGNVQNDGFLFEYEWVDAWSFTYLGRDLREYRWRFKAQTREDSSDAEKYGPIELLVRLANETYPEHYLERLSEYVDLRGFIRFIAAQNFVAEKDGFLGYDGMNNFYLYRLEDRNQHVLIAWDDDNAFRSSDWPLLAGIDDNVLSANAMRVPELRELYGEVLKEAVRHAEERTEATGVPWLEREVHRQLDLISDAMREDPVRPYPYEHHLGARDEMLTFARERSRLVREELVRLGFGDVPASPLRK